MEMDHGPPQGYSTLLWTLCGTTREHQSDPSIWLLLAPHPHLMSSPGLGCEASWPQKFLASQVFLEVPKATGRC
jgi:hypothetical protein